MKKNSFLLILAAAVAPIAAISVLSPVEARPVYVDEDVSAAAVSGYDLVSYFSETGVPQKGSATFSVNYDGADYYFTSAENASKFKADPAAFAPQYGGHCAWAMSRGSLAPGQPELYKVVDGKLYLNFSPDVQKMWLKDIPGFISKADVAWPEIPDDAKFG
jgi:YHS domain-containing protein